MKGEIVGEGKAGIVKYGWETNHDVRWRNRVVATRMENWVNIVCKEAKSNWSWDTWSDCKVILVEPKPDEETCCPRSLCKVTGIKIVEPWTPTTLGVIPYDNVCIGGDKPSEAIRKKEKKKV